MMNEEVKKVYDSITCMDDAYELVCKNGFKGSKQDFGALVMEAAKTTETEAMDLDDMEQVAGGVDFGAAWDKVSNWVSDNPVLTAEIVGTVAVTSAAVIYSVNAYRESNKLEKQVKEMENKNVRLGPDYKRFVDAKDMEYVKQTGETDAMFREQLRNYFYTGD